MWSHLLEIEQNGIHFWLKLWWINYHSKKISVQDFQFERIVVYNLL